VDTPRPQTKNLSAPDETLTLTKGSAATVRIGELLVGRLVSSFDRGAVAAGGQVGGGGEVGAVAGLGGLAGQPDREHRLTDPGAPISITFVAVAR